LSGISYGFADVDVAGDDCVSVGGDIFAVRKNNGYAIDFSQCLRFSPKKSKVAEKQMKKRKTTTTTTI